jgi:hypothetical protein
LESGERIAAFIQQRLFPRAVGANGWHLDTAAIAIGEGKYMYFAQVSLDGPVKYRGMDESIAILDSPEDAKPIGIATCSGWNAEGIAWWKLRLRDKILPGLWVIIVRQFHPVE